MRQLLIICVAILSISSIYIIYQNIQVISSFNKLTNNLNRINENIINQSNMIKQNANDREVTLPTKPYKPNVNKSELDKEINTNTIRDQYNKYTGETYMETDSNVSDKESDKEIDTEAAISDDLKNRINSLEQYDSDDEMEQKNEYFK